jgi:hypothetical protein
MSWINFKRKNYDFVQFMSIGLKYFDFKSRYQDFIVEEKINIDVKDH